MKTTFSKFFAAMLVFSSVYLVSCNNDDDAPTEPAPTPLATTALYDTLGAFIQGISSPIEGQGTKMIPDPEAPGQMIQAGRLAIRTVIEEAEGVLAADPLMAPYFPTLLAEVGANNTTGFFALRENFTDLIQEIASTQTGLYTGLDMVAAHDHATNPRFGSVEDPVAGDDDFDQFVADVVIAMTNLNVPPSVQGQLGAALEATRDDVVQE